ncbi:MAG: creatininase family protein [Thermodesulfobacteriota bacterium]
MLIENITMRQFKDGLKKTKTVIVPFGTVEAHGTHLPLSTDTIIIWEAVKKAAEKVNVFIAPPIYYGVCTSTSDHPGTIGITPGTVRNITTDIVRDLRKKGLRRFILISGHGGSIHVSAMKEAAEALTTEFRDITIAACSVYEILPKEARHIAETEGDSHAGELETSLVLYLSKGLVKGRAKKEFPKFVKPIIARDKIKYWPGAVWGDPSKASVDKGKRFFDIMVKSIVELADKIGRF